MGLVNCKLEGEDGGGGSDLRNLFILVLISAAVGIYVLLNTVLISRDGIFYIKNAKLFLDGFESGIKFYYPGYPFLLFLVYKLAGLFAGDFSNQDWVYLSQSLSLTFKVVSIFPLYYIGKLFLDGRRAFWAVLIIMILPESVELGSGGLRAWPHLLFLSTGILFVLLGFKRRNLFMFGAAGLMAAAGYTIRPECVQVVLYGILLLGFRFFVSREKAERKVCVWGSVLLLAGFAVLAIPYAGVRGYLLPDKVLDMLEGFRVSYGLEGEVLCKADRVAVFRAESVPAGVLASFIELFQGLLKNFRYYFALPVLLGLFDYFKDRRRLRSAEGFVLLAFIVVNVIMMVLLQYNYGYLSARHCFALSMFLVFMVPFGLESMSVEVGRRFKGGVLSTSRFWFAVFVIIGVVICLPKVLKPVGYEKRSFRTAADWIKDNTANGAVLGVSDRAKRIGFYANRECELLYEQALPGGLVYIVERFKYGKDKPVYFDELEERYEPVKRWESDSSEIVFYELKRAAGD